MTRSFGGRARQAQLVTRERPPRAPAAVFAAPTGFCETFPNDGLLGVDAQDQPWNAFDGEISGGMLTGAPFADGRMEVDAGSTDMFVEADMTDFSYLYLVARCGDGTDLYDDLGVYLYVDPGPFDTYIEIGDWTGGTISWVDPAGDIGDATWRLEVVGDTARALRDGVEILTADVSGVTTTGQRGGFEYQGNSHFEYSTNTVTESFNTSNGTTIGPDRNWTKQSIVNGGPPGYTDDGVIFSNSLALQGHDGMFGGADDGYAHISIVDSNQDTQFNYTTYDAYVQARIVAMTTASGTHGSSFTVGFRYNAYEAVFVNDSAGQYMLLFGFGSSNTPCSFGPGDLLRVEHDPGANTITGLINGVVIDSITANFASILEPRLGILDTAGGAPFVFSWAHEDRLDEYEAHGTVQSLVYDGTLDNFCVGPA